jgi:hypothetical protein
LKGPDELDEEEPAPPKFREGFESLDELDLEPTESGDEKSMDAAEKIADAAVETAEADGD